jgi:hypothetical protein
MHTSYDTEFDEPDLEEDGWTRQRDEDAFQPYRPARAGRYGPTSRDEEFDDDAEDNRAARRARGERGSMSARAVTGVVVLGSAAAGLVWIFAGPVVAVAAAGTGVVVWVGKAFNVVGEGARRRRADRRERRGDRRDRAARRRSARRGGEPGKGGLINRLLGGGRGRGAGGGAGRRANLLGGAGAGGLGGGRGRGAGGRGLGGLLGGRGRGAGAGAGTRAGAGAGGRGRGGASTPGRRAGTPGFGGVGRRGGSPVTGTRTGGVGGRRGGPAGRGGQGGGQHRAPSRLQRMMPTARGAQARQQARKFKLDRAKTKQQARQMRQQSKGMRSQNRQARADRRHQRWQNRQTRRDNRIKRRQVRRGLWGRRLRVTGLVALAPVLGVWWVVRRGVVRPVWFVTRHGLVRPARWIGRTATAGNLGAWFSLNMGYRPRQAIKRWTVASLTWMDVQLLQRPNQALTNFARTRWARRAIRRRARSIYFWPELPSRIGGRLTPAWFTRWWPRLRGLSARRGRWAMALGVLLLAMSALWYAGRKAREWAWDGKPAVNPLDDVYDEYSAKTPPDYSAQPDPADTVDPAATPGPAAKPAGSPWFPTGDPAQTPEPAQGYGPANTGGSPEMVARLTTPSPTVAATAGSSDLLAIPAGLHPRLSALCEDASMLLGRFDPQSMYDLASFLNSMHDALLEEQKKWKAVGDNLIATFPGFVLAAQFADRMEIGYSHIAQRSQEIFQGFRTLHAADFARFDDPRVNEVYADVARWAGSTTANIRPLSTGGAMHGSHTLWLTSCDYNLATYNPADAIEEDRLQDLRWWLHSLSPFMAARARYAIAFTHNLVQGFPIESGVDQVVKQLARGFADLSDFGRELAHGYEARSPHDIKRRDNGGVNEHKRDVGNTATTNSGARY